MLINPDYESTEPAELVGVLKEQVRKVIGPIATPDRILTAPGLPKHESAIFSMAVSRDGGFLALGGTEAVPISVWRLADGAPVARLSGLPQQAHALAFSPDGARLAAANLWGGVCVWSLADQALIDQKPETSARKFRSLEFPDAARPARWPVMLSDSIFGATQRRLSPNGKLVADGGWHVTVREYRTKLEPQSLPLAKYEFPRSAASHIAWAADSRLLALAGDGWAGAWRPFDPEPIFVADELPFAGRVDALAVFGPEGRLLYAKGRSVGSFELPETPRVTKWQGYLHAVLAAPAPANFRARHEWCWNFGPTTHDGVHTINDELLWFSSDRMGGSAHTQSFASFLADGPDGSIPEAELLLVSRAVLELSRS